MRKYKHLFIPDRFERNNDNIYEKQAVYCEKSKCESLCSECLFHGKNIDFFENWYMSKNKKTTEVK